MELTKKILFGVVVYCFAYLSSAQASWLVEPSLGYAAKSKLTIEGTGVDVESSGSPAVLGLKLGFQYFGLMGGFSYKENLETDYDFVFNGTSFDDEKEKRRDFGLFIGYNLPTMLRVWGSYYFDTKSETKSGPDSGDWISGSSLGLGVGWTVLPLISLNLEYLATSYDKTREAGVTGDIDSAFDVTQKQILLSISLPLRF